MDATVIESTLRSRDLKFIIDYIGSEVNKQETALDAQCIMNGIWGIMNETFKGKDKTAAMAKTELLAGFKRYLKGKSFERTALPSDLAVQMHKLFRGHRSYFSYFLGDNTTLKYNPLYFFGPTANDFRNHLSGHKSITCVPIDIDISYWGAIDVDVHDEKCEPIDYIALEKKVREKKYPLVLCRSKSERGVHLFFFCKEGVESETLRELLKKFAVGLELSDVEIFPKQDMLRAGRCGNVLNMPYYKSEERACVYNGEENLSLLSFLELARSQSQTREQVINFLTPEKASEVSEAPPCLEKIIMSPEVYKLTSRRRRNETLYSVAVYYSRLHSKDYGLYQSCCDAFVRKMDQPLSREEVRNTINSVWDNRAVYRYKCKESPLQDAGVCNKAECGKRKYGIMPKSKAAYIEDGEAKKEKKAKREEQFKSSFEMVTDFTIVRYTNSSSDEDLYEFKYNGKKTKELPAKLLLDGNRLNEYLLGLTGPNFPLPTRAEKELYTSLWFAKREEAVKEDRIRLIDEDFAEDGGIRLAVRDYVESEDSKIKEFEEFPEQIETHGMILRESTISGVSGDFFICKNPVLMNFLRNELDELEARKLKKQKVFDSLSRYRIISGRVNLKISEEQKKQYRVWALPLEPGTRELLKG